MTPLIDPDNLAFYRNNGYLLIENYLSNGEIEALKLSARYIVDDFDLDALSVFSTKEQGQHSDQYFLDSASRVSCFFEPEAVDDQGQLTVDKHLAINKIGHAMHDLVPLWKRIAYRKSLFDFAKATGMTTPAIVQSQYIYKQPRIGGQVDAHTDSSFIRTEPLSCLGAWVALEDADTENGCLLALPGSQNWPLQTKFVRTGTNGDLALLPTDHEKLTWDTNKMIPLEVKKGTLVLLHGSLVHSSYPNQSERSRHAFVLHLADLASEWLTDNWLQRTPALPFRPMSNHLMIP